MRAIDDALITHWIRDMKPTGIGLNDVIPRLVAWHCTAKDDRYIDELVAHLRAAPEFLEMFRSGQLTGVVFHCGEKHLPIFPGIFPIRLGDVAYRTFPGPEYWLIGSFIKIITPLVFPNAGVVLNLDADMSFGRGQGDWDHLRRLTGQSDGVESLFDLAERFGFIVTAHPDSTWTGEPMMDAQKADYMERPGMHRLIPLYACGAFARSVDHEGQRRLTAAWVQEFLEAPLPPNYTPEQTSFSAAVWRSGFAPLAAPMTFCSLYATRIRFGLECLYVHQGAD